MNKYKAKTTFVGGKRFDSKKEARRYIELRAMEKAGLISCLQRQVPYVIIPAQYDDAGKLVERPVRYTADFTYIENGKTVVEDVKGMKTRDYIIKRKLMRYLMGCEIREI